MTNSAGERQCPEAEIFQELFCAVVLNFILGTLQQFQVSLNGDETLTCLIHEVGSLAVSPFNPYENISIKYHGNALHEDGPFPFPRAIPIRAC